MKTDRTKKSILNMSSNFFILITQTILSFVVRTFFIKYLGEGNLGLEGLLTNILSMLSLSELGISTAISFMLYKPLADHDKKKINVIMNFYRKMYMYIGIFILVIGTLLIPFLNYIINDYAVDNIYLIYILYLVNTVSLYFISYKEILIMADQKNYKLTLINFFFTVLMYLLQAYAIIKYQNFIFYLIVQLIIKTAQRIFINIYISKKYKNISFKNNTSLSKSELNYVKTNIKSLFYSKIGDYCIYSTDNILISKIVNLVNVGFYTNYMSIVTVTRSIINSFFNGITASFGNLAVESDKESQKNVFEIMDFMSFVFYGFFTIIFLIVLSDFIGLWIGSKFIISKICVVLICINFYLMGTQVALDTIKQATGFYQKDKYVPIIQAIVNLTLSIILGIKFGLIGIILGTTISYIVLPCWNKPYLIYKNIFESKSSYYFSKQLKNIISLLLVYYISIFVISNLSNVNGLLLIIIKCIVISIIYLIIIFVFYFKDKEFKFFEDFIKSKFLELRKK